MTLPLVICIDGPSASGKGTISKKLAKKLGWGFLDSGSIYRIVALSIINHDIDITDTAKLLQHLQTINIQFNFDSALNAHIFLDHKEVSKEIRQVEIGEMASKIAAIGLVRQALLQKQRDFRKAPGLVADGRDMGTVVFKDAILKFYLDASSEVRAKRREKQLSGMGVCVSMTELLAQINARDERDKSRKVAPLTIASDAIVIDTSTSNVDTVFERVYTAVLQKLGM